jgi:hypothetical protein
MSEKVKGSSWSQKLRAVIVRTAKARSCPAVKLG